MQATEIRALIREFLQQSALELLADVGAQFEPARRSDWAPDIIAVLGIAGTNVAGSVALGTSHVCLSALAKLANTDHAEDWLGELSNQLTGRFKRRMGKLDVTFGLGTPVVLLGERLRLPESSRREELNCICLVSQIGRAEVWLEMEFPDGFLLATQLKDDDSLCEGEAMLF